MVDKRKQQFPCAFCDRIFQQKDRHAAHIKSKHADEAAEAEAAADGPDAAAAAAGAAATPSKAGAASGVMTAASKAGYYTSKSPGLLLLEHMRASQQPKARVKAIVRTRTSYAPTLRACSNPANLSKLARSENGCKAALPRCA